MDETEPQERKTMVIERYQGILSLYEAFYIQSIIYAADRASDAFRCFDEAVASSGSQALIMATVQEALTHTGALSRFFWPKPLRKDNRELAFARGRQLCEAFEMADNSPLASRKLRNAFEHFDEDLDRYLLQDLSGHFFPGPIVGPHTLADEAGGHIFKLVDPEAGVCVLLGEKFEFHLLRDEVGRILKRAMKMDQEGGRLFPVQVP